MKTQKKRGKQFDFEKFLNDLLDFKAINGHVNVPQAQKPLGTQVNHVRSGAIKLNPEQRAKLDEIGFVWNAAKRFDFEKFYQDLLDFKAINGHVNVPVAQKPLGTQVSNVRRGDIKLNPEQRAKLDDIGFVWNAAKRFDFEKFYQDLLDFKAINGHVNVPVAQKPLGKQVSNVRSGLIKLNPEQRAKLDDIGFVWNAKQFDFEKFYQDLLDFKAINGHVNVPQAQKPLGPQVSRVRSGLIKLNPEQRAKLDDIGFVWNAKQFDFEKFYQDLLDFKAINGHVNVPVAQKPLGTQVSHVRSGDIKLNPEQRAKLDDIGFVWGISYPKKLKIFNFSEFLNKYLEYQNLTNDKIVAHDVKINNYPLGFYVRNIRTNHIKLDSEQKAELDRCGFVYDTKNLLDKQAGAKTSILQRMLKGDMTARLKLIEASYHYTNKFVSKTTLKIDKESLQSICCEKMLYVVDTFEPKINTDLEYFWPYLKQKFRFEAFKFYQESKNIVSLSTPILNHKKEDTCILEDMLADKNANTEKEALGNIRKTELLAILKSKLSKPEYYSICLNFGIIDGKTLTPAEIATKYNTKQQIVEHAIANGLQKLENTMSPDDWQLE